MADLFWVGGASAVVELGIADGLVKLIGDLPSSAIWGLESGSAVDALAAPAAVFGAQVISIEPVEADFALGNEWRNYAQAWVCAHRILLRPEWVSNDEQLQQQVDQGLLLEVVLEPGSAFGSGSHMTTRLCVGQLAQLDLAAARVLDVGCGTGVLSVVSALLGADSVLCVDSDPEAVRVTRIVAELNGVSEKIQTLPAHRFAGVGSEFDLVLANLLLPIIEEIAAPLANSVAPGGLILVSGVLSNQQQRVEASLSGLALTRVEQDDGWLALLFQRPYLAASE